MENYSFSFERLDSYQLSRKLVVDVYKIISSLPGKEKFSMASQLQRSIVSVPSNIAEGSGRSSIKEKIHFIEIAYGSLMEAYCQIEICRDLDYITDETLKSVKSRFLQVSRLINGLRNSFIKQLPQKP